MTATSRSFTVVGVMIACVALARLRSSSGTKRKNGEFNPADARKRRKERVERLAMNVVNELVSQKEGCMTIGFPVPKSFWVGICGVPGAGKSTLAAELGEELRIRGLKAALVPMDGYHYPRKILDTFPDPNLAHERRGAPFTFDAARFASDLRKGKEALEHGMPAYFPSFDHAVKDPIERSIEVPAGTEVVIVEGNYLLLEEDGWADARNVLDKVYFLNVPLNVAKQRLASRHSQAWNWPLDQAMKRVEESDFLNMVLIEATRGRADTQVSDA